jgi:hypothetical protein
MNSTGLTQQATSAVLSFRDELTLKEIIADFQHEIGGHSLHDWVGESPYWHSDAVMRELYAIFVERKLGTLDHYPKDPHKRALSLLLEIENTTPFGNLEFAQQRKILNGIYVHKTALSDVRRHFDYRD